MKHTYKAEMEKVSLSKESRARILHNVLTHQPASATKKPSLTYLRPALAAAAFLIVAGSAVTVTYFNRPANGNDTSLSLPGQQSNHSTLPQENWNVADSENGAASNAPQQTASAAASGFYDDEQANGNSPQPRLGASKPASASDAQKHAAKEETVQPTADLQKDAAPKLPNDLFSQVSPNPTAAPEIKQRTEALQDAAESDSLSAAETSKVSGAGADDRSSLTPPLMAGVFSSAAPNESSSDTAYKNDAASGAASGGGGGAASSSMKRAGSLVHVSEAALDTQRNADCGFSYQQFTRLPATNSAPGTVTQSDGAVSIRYDGTNGAITLTAENRPYCVSWPHETYRSSGKSIALSKESDLVVRAAWFDDGVTYTIAAPSGLEMNTILSMIDSMAY